MGRPFFYFRIIKVKFMQLYLLGTIQIQAVYGPQMLTHRTGDGNSDSKEPCETLCGSL